MAFPPRSLGLLAGPRHRHEHVLDLHLEFGLRGDGSGRLDQVEKLREAAGGSSVNGFAFQIELLCGPDDGAIFTMLRQPPNHWDMPKLKAVTVFVAGKEKVDRYWRSDRLSERGTILYYHEDFYGDAVSA